MVDITIVINHYNPHENYSYIYQKPLNSATYKPTERYLGGPILQGFVPFPMEMT